MPGPQVVVRACTSKPASATAVTLMCWSTTIVGPSKVTSKRGVVGRRHVVDGPEVRPVDDVLGQVLQADAHPVGVDPPRRPRRAVVAVGGHVVLRRRAAGVVPHEDPAVALADVPGAGRRPGAAGARGRGTSTTWPSPSKRQPWNGQTIPSPHTRPPTPRWAPRCGQCASKTRAAPSSPRNATSSRPR